MHGGPRAAHQLDNRGDLVGCGRRAPPSGSPRFTRQAAPSTRAAASPSATRSSGVPLLPISPRVRSHSPTRAPSAACLASVAGHPDLDVVGMRAEGQQVHVHGRMLPLMRKELDQRIGRPANRLEAGGWRTHVGHGFSRAPRAIVREARLQPVHLALTPAVVECITARRARAWPGRQRPRPLRAHAGPRRRRLARLLARARHDRPGPARWPAGARARRAPCGRPRRRPWRATSAPRARSSRRPSRRRASRSASCSARASRLRSASRARAASCSVFAAARFAAALDAGGVGPTLRGAAEPGLVRLASSWSRDFSPGGRVRRRLDQTQRRRAERGERVEARAARARDRGIRARNPADGCPRSPARRP